MHMQPTTYKNSKAQQDLTDKTLFMYNAEII